MALTSDKHDLSGADAEKSDDSPVTETDSIEVASGHFDTIDSPRAYRANIDTPSIRLSVEATHEEAIAQVLHGALGDTTGYDESKKIVDSPIGHDRYSPVRRKKERRTSSDDWIDARDIDTETSYEESPESRTGSDPFSTRPLSRRERKKRKKAERAARKAMEKYAIDQKQFNKAVHAGILTAVGGGYLMNMGVLSAILQIPFSALLGVAAAPLIGFALAKLDKKSTPMGGMLLGSGVGAGVYLASGGTLAGVGSLTTALGVPAATGAIGYTIGKKFKAPGLGMMMGTGVGVLAAPAATAAMAGHSLGWLGAIGTATGTALYSLPFAALGVGAFYAGKHYQKRYGKKPTTFMHTMGQGIALFPRMGWEAVSRLKKT